MKKQKSGTGSCLGNGLQDTAGHGIPCARLFEAGHKAPGDVTVEEGTDSC